jgi:hypothetical protein
LFCLRCLRLITFTGTASSVSAIFSA